MNYEDYHLPANFTDAGKLLGMFPIRNAIEALVLAAPIIYLCLALLPLGMFLAVDFCWDKCKESRVQKKALMPDELWCLIGASSNPLAADYVLEIYKTIRGYGGSAICAMQDLNDFFALEGGKYEKGIINNSRNMVWWLLPSDLF